MEEIKTKFHILEELCIKFYVLKLYLIGSYAKKEQNENSDIDFVVYFKNDLPLLDYADIFFDLIKNMEIIYNKKIDLISGKSLKNPFFISEIEKTKVLIYDFNN